MFGGPRERRDQQLLPLTHELLVSVLEAEDCRYSVDSDGDVHGFWGDGDHFYFLRLGPDGEIFQVRGRWHRSLPVTLAREAQDLCAEWNRDKIFPKAYLVVDDSGRVHLYGEVSADFEHGVTAAQLTQVLDCGVGTALQLFDAAEERFPEHVVPNLPHLDD